MSDKLWWQYDRGGGETYAKSDIGTSKLLVDSKYRGWNYTAVISISNKITSFGLCLLQRVSAEAFFRYDTRLV